jgi:hypothetical protein
MKRLSLKPATYNLPSPIRVKHLTKWYEMGSDRLYIHPDGVRDGKEKITGLQSLRYGKEKIPDCEKAERSICKSLFNALDLSMEFYFGLLNPSYTYATQTHYRLFDNLIGALETVGLDER